ncbi:6518_t:CDS:2, partial [Ambispora gerdemannii]
LLVLAHSLDDRYLFICDIHNGHLSSHTHDVCTYLAAMEPAVIFATAASIFTLNISGSFIE